MNDDTRKVQTIDADDGTNISKNEKRKLVEKCLSGRGTTCFVFSATTPNGADGLWDGRCHFAIDSDEKAAVLRANAMLEKLQTDQFGLDAKPYFYTVIPYDIPKNVLEHMPVTFSSSPPSQPQQENA